MLPRLRLRQPSATWAFFGSRYGVEGLYLLDEPESALSPRRQMELRDIIGRAASHGQAQFIVATHSPILLSLPGDRILSFRRRFCAAGRLRGHGPYPLLPRFLRLARPQAAGRTCWVSRPIRLATPEVAPVAPQNSSPGPPHAPAGLRSSMDRARHWVPRRSHHHRNLCGGILQSVVQYIAASGPSDGFPLASSVWPFLVPMSHSSPRFVSILLSPQ